MIADLLLYVAVAVGFAGGFFTCSLMVSRSMQRRQERAYLEGFAACNRAHQEYRYGIVTNPRS